MRRAPAALALVGACVGLVACEGPNPGTGRTMWVGDRARFASAVQPILSRRCGSPGCHGDVRRPLVVYGIGGLRMDPAATYDDAPLTAEEQRRGFLSACAFLDAEAATQPARCAILRKPLGSRAGAHHGGGNVFVGLADLDAVTLADWIAHARPEGEGDADGGDEP